MFINYAHRGASEYAPENTLASFYMGLEMNANGIETDVKKTKDGVLVLFHDPDIYRITKQNGKISDYTYEELYQFDFGGYKEEKYINEKIVKFEDFLRYFSQKAIRFAIELKETFIEQDVLDLINRFNVREKVEITSFEFSNLERVRKLDKDIKIGFLTDDIDDEVLNKLAQIGANQICPKGCNVTKEKVLRAKEKGFEVRAWKIINEELMKNALVSGVDGMTVNFPDKLNDLLKLTT